MKVTSIDSRNGFLPICLLHPSPRRPLPLLKRIILLPSTSSSSFLLSLSSISRNLSTSPETQSQKLNRIADDLISLNKLERYDYSILFRLKLGISNTAPSLAGLDPPAAASDGAGSAAGADAKAAEKTVFDVKLDKFAAAAKIKVIKEVRSFTELGLKEAKDLVEKAPIVVKKGVSKEEGESIIEKLKALGATVVLE